jgi:nicotinamide-nucleotide amidase
VRIFQDRLSISEKVMIKANEVVKTLMERNLTIALAESITAGLATAKLAVYQGVNEMLVGGVVCYSETVKTDLMEVKPKLIEKYTAESQEVTDQLALHLPHVMKANIYAAITGLACEGGSETPEKPVGTVFFSVLMKGELHKRRVVLKGTPSEVRDQACEELYGFVLEVIGSEAP